MDSEENTKNNEIVRQSNKVNRFFRILWLIPVLAIGYIGWLNLMPLGGTTTYFIDVGGEDSQGNAKITGPFDRISEKETASGTSFRELEKNLVYFELDDRRLSSADEVGVSVRLKDNFPGDAKFSLGARNEQEWSYYWKEGYIPFYDELVNLPTVTANESVRVYATGRRDSAGFQSPDDFLQNPPLGAVIATSDKELEVNQRTGLEESGGIDISQPVPVDMLPVPLAGYSEENGVLFIDTALRGAHTLWAYVTTELLEVYVTKQDLNWYEGSDELSIEVYSFDGELRGKTAIPDDGDESNEAELGQLQSDSLKIEDLAPDIYRIDLKGSNDLLIRKIEVNQAKLVVDKRVFPAGVNPAYFKDGPAFYPLDLYGNNFAAGKLKMRVVHNSALQQVSIQQNDSDTMVDINMTHTDFSTNLKPGPYRLTVPRQDVIINSSGYLSFTPESFFLPKRCEVVDLKYDLLWALQDVDYIMVNYGDYLPPIEDDGWLVTRALWKTEDLYISNNKLSFCLSAPHLNREPARSVPVDWIKITIKTLPIWKR
jgi:hypothetical protein